MRMKICESVVTRFMPVSVVTVEMLHLNAGGHRQMVRLHFDPPAVHSVQITTRCSGLAAKTAASGTPVSNVAKHPACFTASPSR